jgi:hypothetical protein
LRRKDWVSGNVVSAAAFIPDANTGAQRNDGLNETSINWEDDDTVLAAAFEARAQSEHGVARLLREYIDLVRQRRHCVDKLDYERKVVDGNPHHGNLLYRPDCGKPMEKMIATALALDAEFIPRT